MCECSSRISRLESEIGTLRAEQRRHDVWHQRRDRDRVAQELFLTGLGLGAVQLFGGTFLFVTGMLEHGAARHAWAVGVPLMLGGAIMIAFTGFGVFAPARSG